MKSRVQTWARFGFAAILLAWAGVARADKMDQFLAENARPILSHLTDQGYANVGVLKFEVMRQGPNDPAPIDGGQLGDLMATRLENALILALPDRARDPFGVIRGASRVAVEKDPRATYHTPEGRARLFAHDYPLAWGNKTVKADALLAGRVLFDPDLKKASVSLRVIDGKTPTAAPQEVPLSGGLVAVTRQMLSDANQPFVVPRGVLDLPDPLDQAADLAAQPVAGTRKEVPPETGKVPPTAPEQPAGIWAEIDQVLEFKVFYGGEEVARKPDGNYPPPQMGQDVYLTMKVKTKERLGVVLLVNGINTADNDGSNKEITAYTKWVLDPGKNYWVRGYYDGKEVHTFKTADTATGIQKLSGLAPADRVGLIELHVFREVPEGAVSVAKAGDRVIREEIGVGEDLAAVKLAIRRSMAKVGTPTTRALIIPGKTEKATAPAAEFRGYFWAKAVARYAAVGDDK